MSPDQAGTVLAIDHVALPLRHTEAMIAFYRSLGLTVDENPLLVQVHLGDQMINFHQPSLWQGDFSLRAPAAVPPCGDLCFVWPGTADALAEALDRASAGIVEGPVERVGGRGGVASSVYVRDPDGNLLEFMIYPDGPKEKRYGS
jgi:catechol 2,3-dioxygenase-like lactoylglutathione lyase family enzyme